MSELGPATYTVTFGLSVPIFLEKQMKDIDREILEMVDAIGSDVDKNELITDLDDEQKKFIIRTVAPSLGISDASIAKMAGLKVFNIIYKLGVKRTKEAEEYMEDYELPEKVLSLSDRLLKKLKKT